MTMLLTGGSGCGKSAFAERVVATLPKENRVYIATMCVCDEESRQRVARHMERRSGMGFCTVEQQKCLSMASIRAGSVALLEDLPNLLANEMFWGGDPQRILPDLHALAEKCSHLVIVTNDVFSDGEKYAESTQEYMRLLAEINCAVAEMADCVAEVVYGIPLPRKGVLPCD